LAFTAERFKSSFFTVRFESEIIELDVFRKHNGRRVAIGLTDGGYKLRDSRLDTVCDAAYLVQVHCGGRLEKMADPHGNRMNGPFPQQFADFQSALSEEKGIFGHFRVFGGEFEYSTGSTDNIGKAQKKITQGMAADPFAQDDDLP